MTLITRATARQKVLALAGGHVEALTSAGDTTSLISTAMIGRGNGSNAALKGWGTYDGTDAQADAFRIITSWNDLTGDATIGAMSGARAGTEMIEYYPRDDPGPFEYNAVINRVLSESKRITETIIPTSDGSRRFPLDIAAPWVELRPDIVDVRLRRCPNFISNADFQSWGRGQDAQLQGWVLSGTAATITRVDGPYSYAARITRAGTDAVLTQTIPIPITELYGDTISLFGRMKCSTADVLFIRVNDGTDTTDSSNHDGGGDWDEFTITHTVNADAVGPLTIEVHLIDSDVSGDVDRVVAVNGSSVPSWLSKYGDQYQPTSELLHTVQMYGPTPVIETAEIYTQGYQLVLQTRQPFFELSADSGSGGVTDMPLDALVAGTIVKLAEQQLNKPNAAKWNELYRDHRPVWRDYQRQLKTASHTPVFTRISVGPA